jgi:DNA-binding PadR family transcriptional regulator
MVAMSNSDMDGLISDFSRLYMLMILYEGPHHGYSIMSTFKERLKKDVSPSMVYPFLKSLEGKGLVLSTIKPVGEKDRKVYELTDSGESLCRQLFERFAGIVSTAIEPSVDMCAHCGCKIFEGGHKVEMDGKEVLFCCEHCAHHYVQESSESDRKPLFG